jgi:hypothetical protein
MGPLLLDLTLVAKVTLQVFRAQAGFREKRRLRQERLAHPLEVHL